MCSLKKYSVATCALLVISLNQDFITPQLLGSLLNQDLITPLLSRSLCAADTLSCEIWQAIVLCNNQPISYFKKHKGKFNDHYTELKTPFPYILLGIYYKLRELCTHIGNHYELYTHIGVVMWVQVLPPFLGQQNVQLSEYVCICMHTYTHVLSLLAAQRKMQNTRRLADIIK